MKNGLILSFYCLIISGYPSDKFLVNLQKKPEVVEYLQRLPNKPTRVDFNQYFRSSIKSVNVDEETYRHGKFLII